ncbi:hypothetical protein HYH03_001410 [Edaphochlamys debaryana]|uniref:Uncharacterized protein n=1 Tax=Edaphochlamys debaryana TaxID=47281 RepID=A0A835YDE0_9CHLO|nr:hypothetical protein HYH03_001410 [Edaphochlamys debaryana]|eukprot:KAG2500643.1 hypothetical protein HYH03_001410 [Edaphochlamys debaryana]
MRPVAHVAAGAASHAVSAPCARPESAVLLGSAIRRRLGTGLWDCGAVGGLTRAGVRTDALASAVASTAAAAPVSHTSLRGLSPHAGAASSLAACARATGGSTSAIPAASSAFAGTQAFLAANPTSASASAAAASLAPSPNPSRHRQLSTRVHSGPSSSSSGPSSPAPKKQRGQGKAQPSPASSQPQAQAQAQAQAKPSVRYSPLHYNIEEFCGRVVPTEGERRQRQEVIDGLKGAIRKVWPNARAVELQVFGSFANGLSTWQSDLDLVITGVMEPDRVSGGYEPADRARITAKLRKVADSINRTKQVDVVRQQLIPRARIPILKLWTRGRICVDVSVSDDSGPRAARYMAQQCRAYPPLKPLVLVLKAYLKACRLNEVNTGGLSSYSLTNMVIAHLQEELKAGHDVSDLGETLYTFLLRYGEEHDYRDQAVSVASGGIVPKMSLGFAMESARQAALSMGSYDGAVGWQERLCVDCPLTGRDVSNGTFRIDLVRGAFVQAARKLEALARGRRISDTSLNYLQALFDVNRILKRSHPDPYEPYEDEYLKVISRRGGEDEDEELSLSPGTGSDPDDDDDGSGSGGDLGGDSLERRPSAAAAAQQLGQGGRRAALKTGGRWVITVVYELWDVVRLYPVATLCPPLLCFVLLAALGLWGAVAGAQAAAQQRMDGTRSQAVDAATGFQIQLQQSYTPGVTFQLLVKQRPDFGYWVEHFNATAQELLTRVPRGSLWNLQLQPFAQIMQIYPTRPEDLRQLLPPHDVIGNPSRREDVYRAITTRAPAINGPLLTAQGFMGAFIRYPIFTGDVDADETFGFRYRDSASDLPYDQLPASVRSCAICYNSTTREKWWGLLTVAVNLDSVTKGEDAYLWQLRSRGYHYELVHAMQNGTEAEQLIARVGATASLRGSGAVEVDFRVLDSTWTLRVVPSDGFQPSWRGPVIAAVVVVSLLVAALLFVALAFFKRQRLLLQETVAALESLAETTQRLEQEKERMDVLLARQYDLLACLEANGRGKRHKPLQRSNSQANMMSRIEDARRSLSRAKTSLDDPIQVFEVLGEGAFGKVQKGLWRGTVVAVKTMILPANMTGQQKREKMAVMEAAISSSLVHPNIVTTYTYFIRPYHEPTHDGVLNGSRNNATAMGGEGRAAEEGPSGGSEGVGSLDESGSSADEAAIHSYEVRLVLEFCDKGSLKDALDQHAFMQGGALNLSAMLETAADIAKAMVHMHAASVLHSDLKARNIMLKSGGTGGRGVVAKVADFGLSTRMEHQETHLSSCFQGTLTHMAPEVMLEGRISKAADVYSFGILMWELFCASDPFAGVPRAHIGHAITKENRRPKFPPFAPRDYVALASQCWHPDASQRPTFETVLSELTRLREELGGDTPQLVILPPKPPSVSNCKSNSFRSRVAGSTSRHSSPETATPRSTSGTAVGRLTPKGHKADRLASGTPMQLYVAGIVIGDSTAGDSAAGDRAADTPDADAATGGGSAGGGLAALGSLGLLPGQGLGHSAVAARAMLKKALTQRHFQKMGLRMGGVSRSGSSWSVMSHHSMSRLPALIEEHEKAEESDLLPKLASAPTTGAASPVDGAGGGSSSGSASPAGAQLLAP